MNWETVIYIDDRILIEIKTKKYYLLSDAIRLCLMSIRNSANHGKWEPGTLISDLSPTTRIFFDNTAITLSVIQGNIQGVVNAIEGMGMAFLVSTKIFWVFPQNKAWAFKSPLKSSSGS